MAHVLIVEDDRVTSRILARALERAGHQTAIANDGREAIERLESAGVNPRGPSSPIRPGKFTPAANPKAVA